MLVRPNESLIEGEVLGLRPSAEGTGFDLEIRVAVNLTRDPTRDFVRASAGSCLTVYCADRPDASVGDRCRFAVSLLGGPTGQRVVLRSLLDDGDGDGEGDATRGGTKARR